MRQTQSSSTGPRSRALAVFQALIIAAFFAACATGSPRTAAGTGSVTVDLRKPLQVWDGFGSSERLFSDPHVANAPQSVVPQRAQREILSLLYTRLGLTRVRVVLDPGIQAARGGPFAGCVRRCRGPRYG